MRRREWGGTLATLAATALFAFCICGSLAAPPAGDAGAPIAAAGHSYDITSSRTGRSYRIFLRVPAGPAPARGFPVIYVLDGNWFYGTAADAAMLQSATGEIPNAIVAGIGYPTEDTNELLTRRALELSLPATPQQLPPRLKSAATGGADDFYAVLVGEIRPFVEHHAPVDRACQTLFGHSLGGLFALHVAFTNPEAFRSFVAASPAIWWADNAVLKDETSFVDRLDRGEARARLLLTVGGLERLPPNRQLPPGGIDGHMVDNVVALAGRLAAHRSDRFEVQSVVFDGETHNSSAPAAISKALRFGLCTTP